MKRKSEAEAHCKSLIEKYGEEAVSSIKYKDIKLRKGKYSPKQFNTINERTNNLSDYALAGAMTLSSYGLATLLGAPFYVLHAPNTTAGKARNVEEAVYYINRQEQRRAVKEAKKTRDKRRNFKMDYYITSNGELRHAAPNRGWEKEDHKYIKREWKNKRWVYTYPSDTKKDTKAKTNLAGTVRKVTSTARELDAKKKLENRGKLSLEARAALTRGRNAVNNKPWVSKEYLEEVAYNSQKNDGSVDKTTSKKQTSGTTKKQGSSEYEAEVAYNSQKNVFGGSKPVTGESLAIADRPYISVTNTDANQSKDSSKHSVYLNPKDFVKGPKKIADAVTAYNDSVMKADKLSGIADSLSKKLQNSGYAGKAEFDRVVGDMLKAQRGASEAYLDARAAATETIKAIEEASVNRFWKAHDEHIRQDRADRRDNTARDMTDYYLDQAKQIENGTWAPDVKVEPKNRNLSFASFMEGVKDWYGQSEASALDEAARGVGRAKSEWQSAMEDADRAREIYENTEKIAKNSKAPSDSLLYTLNQSWSRLKDAEDYQLMEWARYTREKAEYDKALEAYMKTPAYEFEQNTRPVRELFESVGDSIDSGKDWVDDRMDDLEDWWDDLWR